MVTAEQFVTVWQQSTSTNEVVEKIGGTKNAVQQRAFSYRRRGVPLKHFRTPHTTEHLNINSLIATADKALRKTLGES